mmetsp:Transcript_31844/g.91752  ORF Transcript_31844/g.91752 Transcript_31844/m.91752 type:complete len:235 (+) Transcript_31844:1440-2144(+)
MQHKHGRSEEHEALLTPAGGVLKYKEPVPRSASTCHQQPLGRKLSLCAMASWPLVAGSSNAACVHSSLVCGESKQLAIEAPHTRSVCWHRWGGGVVVAPDTPQQRHGLKPVQLTVRPRRCVLKYTPLGTAPSKCCFWYQQPTGRSEVFCSVMFRSKPAGISGSPAASSRQASGDVAGIGQVGPYGTPVVTSVGWQTPVNVVVVVVVPQQMHLQSPVQFFGTYPVGGMPAGGVLK